MSGETETDRTPGRYASPPCYAAELAPEYADLQAPDPEQFRDIARWRKAQRDRLRAERLAMTVEDRRTAGLALIAGLRRLLEDHFGDVAGYVFSAYWPIKGEPDLRPLMAELHSTGAFVALPLVETRHTPLTFRRWTPETKMVRGDWNIPVPPFNAPEVIPEICLAPLVGWTIECYRLGYGGGYFDRTLAALSPRPFVIGVGFESARLDTIFPQAHDIRLDVILTEAGTRGLR